MLTDEQKEEAYIILGYTAMVSGGAEQKVKWAMYMLESGAESDDLAILATFTPLFNDFEVEDYFNRVLTQLEIKRPDKKEAIYGYVKAMVKKALQSEVMPDEVVAKIYQANIKLDYPSELGEFIALEDEWYCDHVNGWSKEKRHSEILKACKDVYEELEYPDAFKA